MAKMRPRTYPTLLGTDVNTTRADKRTMQRSKELRDSETFPLAAAEIARDAALVFSIVLIASLFGIMSRPTGFLAAIWPANPILLAILVRNPQMATPWSFLAALVGFMAADTVTGGDPAVALWLNLANMAGVLAGVALYKRVSEPDRRLQRPKSMVYLFGVTLVVSCVAAVAGAGASVLVFQRSFYVGLGVWFTTELANAIIVFPLMLAAPPARELLKSARETLSELRDRPWPALMLLGSVLFSVAVGGPGAIAYPVPALLWCALSYRQFLTVILTCAISIFLLIAVAAGWSYIPLGDDELMAMMSLRLAIALLALGPLAVAGISEAHSELVRRLQHAADYDGLTRTLVRSAFMDRGKALRYSIAPSITPVAVLMFDIDNFKQINDTRGHAAGDRVLATFANALHDMLRENDLLGRLGGEEFAVILEGVDGEQARATAERIRAHIEALGIVLEDGTILRITVSGGIAMGSLRDIIDLDGLLEEADRALYRAKAEGKNRIAGFGDAQDAVSVRSAAAV